MPNPSITSSTTAPLKSGGSQPQIPASDQAEGHDAAASEPEPQDGSAGPFPPAGPDWPPDVAPLTRSQQEAVLKFRMRGGSPSSACLRLAVPYAAYARTLVEDEEFRHRSAHVDQLLSENVAAALYRAAMEGNVTAQRIWLQAQPPPHWLETAATESADFLDELTNAELLELARSLGIACEAAVAPGD